jgi:eukaryotic-like serine/threonine-protein kinase
MSEPSHDDRLLDLARRLLDGEAIDWAKEDVAESDVREGMKRLERIIGRREAVTETRHASDSGSPVPAQPAPDLLKDRVIGGFRLVRKLGEGGMGVVYEAEQKHPRRRVALKVIRGGTLVSPDSLKLFRREIQTLARLSHSGIAQLYETGVTDDGMHFFAMELVRGEPLSDWLRSRPKGPMTPAELKLRLGVFRKICDAVAYAHQKGVIHRDLKPGNILIPKPVAESSMQDAVPEVKVLDFGLARITDSDVQATTFVTEMGKVQGTLPYMSPEQVRGNPDEIDLRTDVYALGVILYEMVAGRLPYDISKAQLHEAVRIICEAPPRSLTTTFSGTKRLDADVATIAAKCLEKEAARRYQSAAALGEEIQRYLSNQPILARPPSAAYQFRKLVLRHKGPFAAAAAAFVLLATFAAAMTLQAIRIAKERDRANLEAKTAQRVSTFLEELFSNPDPFSIQNNDMSTREILDAGAARIETELSNEPAIQARLMRTMGDVYSRLELGDKAASLRKRAAELTAKVYGMESLEYADVLNFLGAPSEDQVRAHAIRSRLLKPNDPRMAKSFYYLGGEANLIRALEIIEASPQPDEELHLYILNDLAIPPSNSGDHIGAVKWLRKAQEIRDRMYPEGNPQRVEGLGSIGEELMRAGRLEEARPYLESAFAALKKALPPEHWIVANCAAALGELERLEGRPERARPLLEHALAIYDNRAAREGRSPRYLDGNPWDVEILTSLGLVDETEGRIDDALNHLRRAQEARSYVGGIPSPNRDPAPDYARLLRKAGRIAEAEKIEASMKTPVAN